MADPTDVAIENIANRTMDVKALRKAVYDRLALFSAFSAYSFFNYIGSETPDEIVAGILELKAPNSIVLAYESSEYDYAPMADRTFMVFIAIRNTKMYVTDFDTDPMSDAVKAVIKALDKWSPGGHCRLRVTHDGTMAGSQTYSVAEVVVKAEDQ